MSTASRLKPASDRHVIARSDAHTPSLESRFPDTTANALPSPPPICNTLTEEVPALLTEAARIRYLYDRLTELPEQTRFLLRLHIEQYAKHMVHIGASDVDMGGPAANEFVWYRVDGVKKVHSELGSVPAQVMDVLLLNLLTTSQVDRLLSAYEVVFSIKVEGDGMMRPRRCRACLYFDEENLALNLRLVKDELRPLETLGFHAFVEQGMLFTNVRDGLTLISGATGAGKSTTLDAIIHANNQRVNGHIVVIGDPIEYRHTSDQCIVRHREVGKGVAGYREGVMQAMHQDPDMIVINEMIDLDTMSTVLDAAVSGHRVFSTIHTRSAIETIDRIIAEYPTDAQNKVRARLSDVLNGIVSQKLCPMIGGGRVLAKEVLWMTPAVRAAIKNGNTGEIYQMMWEGSSQGQQTMEQDLHRLFRKGLISAETGLRFANNKKRLKQLIHV